MQVAPAELEHLLLQLPDVEDVSFAISLDERLMFEQACVVAKQDRYLCVVVDAPYLV
jgi:non-ribosomal peptide synthetase component E (peptide arylation enzyme)